jgi:hypothetical protein
LIDDDKARWFAKVQQLYFSLQSFGRTYPFGGLPGREEPYGFCSVGAGGSVYTVVNPTQTPRVVKLPRVHELQPVLKSGRILFRDAGYLPRLSTGPTAEVTLGPEELVVIGYGKYMQARYSLGVQEDVVIPVRIQPLPCEFHNDGSNTITGTVLAPVGMDLRIVMRQFAQGKPVRTARGAPPNGTSLAHLLRIEATCADRSLPVQTNYDKAIWSGLSWGVGEVKGKDMPRSASVLIRCTSHEDHPVDLSVELYAVSYGASKR